jgi:Fe-S-cluster-containing hydrogenase component 2
VPDLRQGNAQGIEDPAVHHTVFATVNGAACVSVQRPGTPCRQCADECPTGAVRLAERDIKLLTDECVGCGRCAAVCPTEAIAVSGFSLDEAGAAVRVQCARVPFAERQADDQIVPCLGGVSAMEWLRLVARSERDIVLMDRGWCRTCVAGGCAAPWEKNLAQAVSALQALQPEPDRSVLVESDPLVFELALDPPAGNSSLPPVLTRRQFFSRFSEPKLPIQNKRSSASGRDTPPGRVSVDALVARRFELSALARTDMLPGELFPAVQIASTCCDNQVCARSCPTGALQVAEDETKRRIDFDAALCIACSECERSCPTQSTALRHAGEGNYGGPVALRTRKRAHCPDCGGIFLPSQNDTRCPACRKDDEMAAIGHGLMRRTRQPDRAELER